MAEQSSSIDFARQVRAHALRMVHSAGASHVATGLSMADILAVLYTGVVRVSPSEPRARDRLVRPLAAPHAGEGRVGDGLSRPRQPLDVRDEVEVDRPDDGDRRRAHERL